MNRLPLLILLSGGALAATTPPSPVQLTATTHLVVRETRDGKTTEALRAAEGVLPGNLLELAQTIRNTSTRDLREIALNMPLDRALTFQSATCTLGGVVTLYSLDGRTYAKAPLMKTVTVTENGRQVQKQVEAKPSEYRGVRWQIPTLKAGETGRCAVRATVR